MVVYIDTHPMCIDLSASVHLCVYRARRAHLSTNGSIQLTV